MRFVVFDCHAGHSRWFCDCGPGGRGPRSIDDQARTLTAAEALSAGASYLVVGRPIIAASDPRRAAEHIAAECRAAAAR